MTEEEREELKKLRYEELRLKEVVHNIENKYDDVNFGLANLEKWKSGRGAGVILMSFVCIISVVLMLPYVDLFKASYGSRMQVKADMVTEAVSATALTFGTLLCIVFLIVDLYFGFKYFMQMGSSDLAKKIALRCGEKNYHYEYKILSQKKSVISKELFEMQSDLNQIRQRIMVLEPLEENNW